MRSWAVSIGVLLLFPTLCSAQEISVQSESASPQQQHLEAIDFQDQIAPLLSKHCVDCHSGEFSPEDLQLEFANEREVQLRLQQNRASFERMAEKIRDGEMPPEDVDRAPLSEDERRLLLTWIDRDLLKIDAEGSNSIPQVARVRRLSRIEYENTIRDLFYFDHFHAEDLPSDDIGYGFDNVADLLSVSPNQLELYLKTAEQVIAQLDKTAKVSPNWAERDGTYFEPDDGVFLPIKNVKLEFNNNQDRVRLVLKEFLPRAYRRPVTEEEIDRLLVFARLSLTQEGESFVRPMSTYAALRAAISSPYFLYRIEQDPRQGTAPINEYELASRLSYFLWSSMPDDELFLAAENDELRDSLDEQVLRMLRDPKAHALTENFAHQWLHLKALETVSPDPNIYPVFDEELRHAMRKETELFLRHIVDEDCSIMDLLNAEYTFLNQRLAKHYGINDVSGDDFQMVQLDPKWNRGGLLTQASILTLTSPPTRTSPVKRGIWILEALFNDPPSAPPQDVPPLEATEKRVSGTVRSILEEHRKNESCAACHAKIDPFGLALENFDAVGAWRDREGDFKIDSSGVTSTGESFRDLAEFRTVLDAKQSVFRQAFVEKLLIYALGRGLEYGDRRAVQEICSEIELEGDRFSSVILAIVTSDLFQVRIAEGN